MSLTLILKDLQIIQESNLSEKRDLSSSLNQALHWTRDQKEKYDQSVTVWDQTHIKGPRLDGKPYLTLFTEEEN